MKNRYSLKAQIMLVICILVAGSILLCVVLNSTLLERYYTMNKRQGMVESYQVMSDAGNAGILNEAEFGITFDNICANKNLMAVIFTPDGVTVQSSVNDINQMWNEVLAYLMDPEEHTILVQTDHYEIMQKTDKRLDADYLILIGTLENGDMILMRTPLESIHESAMLANRFLLIVGLIMIGVSVLISLYLAERISIPLLELTQISKRMANLDFETKYDPDLNSRVSRNRRQRRAYQKELGAVLREDPAAGNEVDQLGHSMNTLSEHLEQTISELKSANVELQSDIEQKTKIDEMRKEFLSNVTHELKTPIALIRGYAEGLQECVNDDEQSRAFYCDVIMDEANKMNTMVRNLLTLNQLEFGQQQITMERFDMTEVINGVINASHIMLEQNGIEVINECEAGNYVWADAFKMEEVFTNYLSNAIHYCSGAKQICVRTEQQEGLLHVSVFNTGDPIPEADLPYIWDKFYKVDKARTREYGGNGIGLSIVKAIMDSHGQKCGVINHADGVEFWMELEMRSV